MLDFLYPFYTRHEGILNNTMSLWILLSWILAFVTVTSAQDCPRDDNEVADSGRLCGTSCTSTAADCRNKRQCVCDGICGMSCIHVLRREYCLEVTASEGVNITYIYENRTFNSQATGQCIDGYQYDEGDENRVCQWDGTWSGNPYRCLKNCPRDDNEAAASGRLCSKSCTTTEYCRGNRQCVCDGICGMSCVPVLRLNYCNEIPASEGVNITYMNPDRTFSSQAVGQCIDGYRYDEGDENRLCQGEGTWSGNPYRCLKKVQCPSLTAPPNGQIRGSVFEYQSQVRFECSEGFILEGSERSQCQADRTWSGEPVSCRAINCGAPEFDYGPNFPELNTLEGGSMNGDSYGYQDVVNFTCNGDRTQVGSTSAYCREDETWSNPPPKCKEYVKPVFSEPEDVKIYVEPRISTATVLYKNLTATDNSGHVKITSVRRSDGKAGDEFPVGVTDITFTAVDPSGNEATAVLHITVLAINCGAPEFDYGPNFPELNTLEGGSVNGDSYGYQDVVNFTCNGDRTQVGSASAYCRVDETWSNPPPKCKESVKPVFSEPEDVTIDAAPGKSSAEVLYNNLTATDNSGHVKITSITRSDGKTGNVFPIAVTDITFTAVDPSGNEATSVLLITVLAQVESFSNTELASGIVSSLLVCIIIIIVVVVIVVRRRRQNSRFDTTGHRGGITRKDNEQILMESHVSTHKKKGEATPGAHSPIPDTYVAMTNEDKNEENLIPIDGEAQGQEYKDPDIAVEEDSWEISWEKLMLGTTILGKGNFGEVREGVVWKNEEKVVKVAVKCLKDGASMADEKDFRDELETMKKVGKHPNIVTLIGSCIHEGILYVALELIEHGNLRSFLRQVRKDGSYTQWVDQLMTFAIDVASGMRYLTNIGVIHRDLAARNVLLGDNYVAKVSDFGLSRDEDIYVQKSKTRIPMRWMPPESIRYQRYTSKSDVWSFGVLLWEIGALGGTPYAGIASKELSSKLKDGYRMPKPDKCSDDMYEVMTSCWQFDPDLRPTFRELHRTLSRMLDDNQIYMRFEVYENVKLSPINTDRDDC